MKTLLVSRNWRTAIIFCIALGALVTVPLLSRAQPSTSINIVNNSSREISHVYFSHVYSDDWSGNQLGDATISAGESFNLSVSPCDGDQLKVIGEDQDGCFVSSVVTCGSNATWTITNATARDCGSQ